LFPGHEPVFVTALRESAVRVIAEAEVCLGPKKPGKARNLIDQGVRHGVNRNESPALGEVKAFL